MPKHAQTMDPTNYQTIPEMSHQHLSVEPIASQRRFHRFSLRTLTVIGAVLMFCAVVTMALTRLPAKALEAITALRSSGQTRPP